MRRTPTTKPAAEQTTAMNAVHALPMPTPMSSRCRDSRRGRGEGTEEEERGRREKTSKALLLLPPQQLSRPKSQEKKAK
jgi:hypothetical protein